MAPRERAPQSGRKKTLPFLLYVAPRWRTCAYVAKRPDARCRRKSDAGVRAEDACFDACGTCDRWVDDAHACDDDDDWRANGREKNTCEWVAREPDRRCHKKNADGEVAWDACPGACGTCDTGEEEGCPPMADGICRDGTELDGDACAYWAGEDGERQFNWGRSDDDMTALGYWCTMTCEPVDEFHRNNEDADGTCDGIYTTYNDAYNCCY